MVLDDQDIIIQDTESYGGKDDQEFSHQSLVMMAMRKAIEYGTMEQTHGVYVTEKDMKGNTKVTYKQDTRKAFIESVRTLKMVMICDFDEDATIKVNALIKKIDDRKQELMNQQVIWWNNLKTSERMAYLKRGISVIQDHFSTDLPFIQTYLFEELEIYRQILEELTLLTERKNFYKMRRQTF